MVYDKAINGVFVNLRSVTEDDAAFILSLRQQSDVAKFMHKLNITVEQEKLWIKKQRSIAGDYFFLIENNNMPIGTIGLCNASDDHCEIGRAASIGNSAENVESFMLVFDFAFMVLGYDYLIGTIFPDNDKVKSLTQRFGVIHDNVLHNIDGLQLNFGKVLKSDYYARRPKIVELIKRATKAMA